LNGRWAIALLALAVGLGCQVGGASGGGSGAGHSPVPGYPSSMAALGDSITTAFGACFAPTDCSRDSWSTGEGSQVNSHYQRILAANPAIAGHHVNLARSGAVAADLPGQAAAIAQHPVDYVTILIGANDACYAPMTSADAYRASIDQTLATLKKAMPAARLLVVSLPDLYRIWELGHTNAAIRTAWTSGACPNLLANPTSTAPVDVDRRAAFRDRVADYNTELREACQGYGPRCRYADIAGFAFDLKMLNGVDFFHPNARGQSTLADTTYPGSFTW
jgi:lysophospholipase L1-like esterase